MEPFTFDQAVIAGLLFLLGLLIGMFLLASPKWKRRYKDERARTQELEREVDRLGRENREFSTLRSAAERHPATGPLGTKDRDRDGTPDVVDTRAGVRHDTPTGLADRDRDGTPDVVDTRTGGRRDGPEVKTTRDWTPVNRRP